MINDKQSVTKKELLLAKEVDLVFMEQLEETRLMSEERDFSQDYEITAISLGYICFFSAAYPITAMILLILSCVKYFIDIVSVAVFQRRYVSSPTKNIGNWNNVFEMLVFLSTIANAAFVWFACDGLKKLLGTTGNSHDDSIRDITIIIIGEHIIFAIKLILSYNIAEVTKETQDRIDKREHRKKVDKIKEKVKQIKYSNDLEEYKEKEEH